MELIRFQGSEAERVLLRFLRQNFLKTSMANRSRRSSSQAGILLSLDSASIVWICTLCSLRFDSRWDFRHKIRATGIATGSPTVQCPGETPELCLVSFV